MSEADTDSVYAIFKKDPLPVTATETTGPVAGDNGARGLIPIAYLTKFVNPSRIKQPAPLLREASASSEAVKQ